ncbi:MAG TPA: hypothetical protein VFX06_01115 [Stellaceae bacterium]|nr:hypothetical protein [Stellaceae bacterium]
MSDREIVELAAILIDEHGDAALEEAESRRDHFARMPHSSGFSLWTRIAAATARLLRERRERQRAPSLSQCRE